MPPDTDAEVFASGLESHSSGITKARIDSKSLELVNAFCCFFASSIEDLTVSGFVPNGMSIDTQNACCIASMLANMKKLKKLAVYSLRFQKSEKQIKCPSLVDLRVTSCFGFDLEVFTDHCELERLHLISLGNVDVTRSWIFPDCLPKFASSLLYLRIVGVRLASGHSIPLLHKLKSLVIHSVYPSDNNDVAYSMIDPLIQHYQFPEELDIMQSLYHSNWVESAILQGPMAFSNLKSITIRCKVPVSFVLYLLQICKNLGTC